MTLPEGFRLNQGNLQDYLECQRRFQLHHLLHVAWPSLVSQPASESENFLRLGTTFHNLVRQHLSGVPLELLTASAHRFQSQQGNELVSWWENYMAALEIPQDLGDLIKLPSPQGVNLFPEVTLSAPLAGHRVIAKYDLVTLAHPDKAVIVDWKTSRNRPLRHWLQERVQTRLYPYLLVSAGKDLNHGSPIQPEQIELRYWFGNFPAQPEHFIYSAEQYLADDAYLHDLVRQIDQKNDGDFSQTSTIERCRYCIYRSLCDRGTKAGPLDDSESLTPDDIGEITIPDMQHIDEIEF